MSAPAIAELQPGQSISGCYLLAAKALPTTKTGNVFGALTLSDRSGSIDAKLWDQAAELLEGLEPGAVVRINGRVDTYQGRRQVVLASIHAEPGADPAQFLPASPVPLDELRARLASLRAQVKDKNLKRLLKRIFQDDADFAAGFERAPAAKGAHHAYVHGLLEHTVSVAGLALKVQEHYPHLNRDLLLAGALLHDIGKVDELTLGPPLDYSDAGRLEGHIALGVRRLEHNLLKMKNFPPELASHLRHLILSHHGDYAFGSPRRPKTAEALVLNFLDDMDAKLAIYAQALKESQGDEGHWSKFNRLLERFLYVGPSPLEGGEAASQGDAPQEEPPGLFDGLGGGGGK